MWFRGHRPLLVSPGGRAWIPNCGIDNLAAQDGVEKSSCGFEACVYVRVKAHLRSKVTVRNRPVPWRSLELGRQIMRRPCHVCRLDYSPQLAGLDRTFGGNQQDVDEVFWARALTVPPIRSGIRMQFLSNLVFERNDRDYDWL